MPLSHLRLPPIMSSPHTLGNELQMKILISSRLTNIFLCYLCIFFTIKLIGIDK